MTRYCWIVLFACGCLLAEPDNSEAETSLIIETQGFSGRNCMCDSECTDGSEPGRCVAGLCMRVPKKQSCEGTSDDCAPGHSCYNIETGAGLVGVCAVKCVTQHSSRRSCPGGQCDIAGYCIPPMWLSSPCDPTCSEFCHAQ